MTVAFTVIASCLVMASIATPPERPGLSFGFALAGLLAFIGALIV